MSERIKAVVVNGGTALITSDGTFHPDFGGYSLDSSDLKDLIPKRTSISNIRNGDVINWERRPVVVVRHVKTGSENISINFCGSRAFEKYCSSCFERQGLIECDYPVKKS